MESVNKVLKGIEDLSCRVADPKKRQELNKPSKQSSHSLFSTKKQKDTAYFNNFCAIFSGETLTSEISIGQLVPTIYNVRDICFTINKYKAKQDHKMKISDIKSCIQSHS